MSWHSLMHNQISHHTQPTTRIQPKKLKLVWLIVANQNKQRTIYFDCILLADVWRVKSEVATHNNESSYNIAITMFVWNLYETFALTHLRLIQPHACFSGAWCRHDWAITQESYQKSLQQSKYQQKTHITLVGAPIQPTSLDCEWWLLCRSRNSSAEHWVDTFNFTVSTI